MVADIIASELSGFETDRVVVRDWSSDLRDPERLAQLQAALRQLLTPDVTEHLPPPLRLDGARGGVAGWIADRASESGVLVIRRHENGDLIGVILLANTTATGEALTLHLGYLLARDVWGQGYASEVLRGLVAAAQALAPVTLVGGVGIDNPASARVLQKAGFDLCPGVDHDTETYALTLRRHPEKK